ncbi:MAG: Protein-arginine kinase [Chlamydiales bacterium]|nr:Protein-arginine kinase [Chlamydiales bacterium]MCH9619677.1 Protein-arginine kinase [Chlamydiales bacterium]MCH9623283.1 Protein-arginine kinase [Chlamydiales bacterium]
MTEKNKLHPIFHLQDLWEKHSHPVWLASSLKLARNIQKFIFPNKLDKSKEGQTLSLLYESIEQCPELDHPSLYRPEEIGSLEKEFLLEQFLTTENFHQAHGGEGFVVDKGGDFLGVFNVEDHLKLHLIDTTQEIEKSWNRLAKIEQYIGKRLDFAYNSRWGFLTSNPSHAGTGLVISLYLHIPAIIHSGELPDLLERVKEEEVEAFGLQGNANEMIGDILVTRNKCTIGLTEEYILTTMRMWATRAVVSETNLRKKIIESNDEQFKNKVTRALGLLTHSYQLEVIEALNAISLVKLGVEIGWIEAPDTLNLNQILFDCRRAHLMSLLEEAVDVPELPKKRAEYLHKIASDLKLLI